VKNCSLYPELSENFLFVTGHHISKCTRNLNDERNAAVGYVFRGVRNIAKSDCFMSVRLSACKSAPTGRICMKFDI
jgi:hypothetical protein